MQTWFSVVSLNDSALMTLYLNFCFIRTKHLDKPPFNPLGLDLGVHDLEEIKTVLFTVHSIIVSIYITFSKLFSSSYMITLIFLSLTLHPHYAGSGWSKHVSQSYMSSFFLWHSSPLTSAWYSRVGRHAPSQIHQIQSECCTIARKNRGMGRESREKRKRKREKGRQVSDLSTSFWD